jgi:hypothetical protein
MAISDEDGSAERLAQLRAARRHLGRLRVAERRDAAHERAADADAERKAEPPLIDEPLTTSTPSAETRTLVIAEEAALEWAIGNLAADREIDEDIEFEP